MIPANLLKTVRFTCLSALILTIMLNHSNAEIPSLLNYQGQVINSGTGEPLDSIVSIVFSIYDDSVTSTPLWTETHGSISVVEGLFAVLLGSQTPVPDLIFADTERWLGIKVGDDSEITPRTRLVSTAYSFHSLYADSAGAGDDGDWTDDGGGNIYRLNGNIGIGTTSPTFKLDIRTSDDLNDGFRLSAGPYNIMSTQNGGVQLKPYPSDWADAVLIQNYGSGGVARTQIMTTSSMGENGRPNLTYPHLSLQPNGGNVGIGTTSPAKKLQVNASAADAALRLHAPAGDNNRPTPYLLFTGGYRTNNGAAISGKSDQIFGQTALSFYAGWNTSTHGDDPGIGDLYERMRIASNGNVGIGTTSPGQKLHVAGAVTATTYYGDGSNLTGISGTTDNDWTISGSNMYSTVSGNIGIGTTSPNYKFHSQTAGVNNQSRAIYGVNTQTGDAGGIGVFGETKGRGKGGVGGCDDTSPPIAGSAVGVWGEASSVDSPCGGAAFGVFGRCRLGQIPGSTPSAPAGGYFEGLTSSATNKSNICMGVFGETWSTALGAAGVKGKLKETNAQGRAIWGEASPNGTGWAGYFDGNVRVTGDFSALGSKSAVLENFEDGKTRYIYSQESPEVWFEDFGEGQLKQGIANILLDALFLETVTINGQHPMKVFVTLNGDCNGVYVKRGSSSFVVKELNNGKSSAQFTYRVVAKRKGFENKRFEVDEKFIASTEAINQNQ